MSKKAAPSTAEVYEQITQTILDALDAGTVPWHKPWTTNGLWQQSVHGRPYRGLNQMLLGWSALQNGYTDPRWITFNMCRKQGGQVRKGEKSTIVTLWKRIIVKDETAEGGKKVIPLLRIYRVFNVTQTTLDLPALETNLREHTPVEEAEAIWAGYQGAPPVKHGDAGAWYSPMLDEIGMPDPERFDTPEHYYSTLFHEGVHSTGAAKRLNREECAKSQIVFGSSDYSREELVAEIGAAMLRGMAGIDSEAVMSTTASYIDHWRRKLGDDPKLIVQAAGRAQKAADYILGIGWDEENGEMVETAKQEVPGVNPPTLERLLRDRQLLTLAARISEQIDAVDRSYSSLARIEPCEERTVAGDALRTLRWKLDRARTEAREAVSA